MRTITQCICTRHLPSTGGELPCAERYNHPVKLRLPPLHRRGIICSYGFRGFGGYAEHHPVKLRLPPLHRRGIICSYGFRGFGGYAEHHPVKRSLTPLHRRGIAASTGGELPGAERYNHPVKLRLPPLHRRGIICSYGFRGFGGYAEHHPVKLRLPPLHRRGIGRSTGGELAAPQEGNYLLVRFSWIWWLCRTPPRQAELDTPPQEGNCRLQGRGIAGADMTKLPRQAPPPGTDAM